MLTGFSFSYFQRNGAPTSQTLVPSWMELIIAYAAITYIATFELKGCSSSQLTRVDATNGSLCSVTVVVKSPILIQKTVLRTVQNVLQPLTSLVRSSLQTMVKRKLLLRIKSHMKSNRPALINYLYLEAGFYYLWLSCSLQGSTCASAQIVNKGGPRMNSIVL